MVQQANLGLASFYRVTPIHICEAGEQNHHLKLTGLILDFLALFALRLLLCLFMLADELLLGKPPINLKRLAKKYN